MNDTVFQPIDTPKESNATLLTGSGVDVLFIEPPSVGERVLQIIGQCFRRITNRGAKSPSPDDSNKSLRKTFGQGW